MDREIKFRVWGNFNGQNQMMEVSPMSICNNGLWLGFPIPAHFDGLPEEAKIMQFTGLLDKNGTEIYEYHEIDGKYRVVYFFNRYILRDISNSDIFVEISENEQYEITGEYRPI